MNVNSVAIYEFSTGIKFDRLNNGGWVSRGFTGEYMNCTIDPVPMVVERSISNREFRIAEGTASEDPAVVGRVVGEGQDSWSVVAIISRGEDEVGRGGSFYRYFIVEGSDKIPHILEWLEQDKQNRKSLQIRVFNPLDTVFLNQPHIITIEPKIPNIGEKQLDLLDDDIPIILANKIPTRIYIHALTLKKVELERSRENHVPLAWAFNVEAVEQVNRFTIIRSASENALGLLNRAKASAGKALPLVLFDEQAVKSAIKGLSNNSSTAIKSEYVRTFTEAIGNQVIDSTHWDKIFDGQGANNALKQKIYTPQMIKLLVIRALAIPSTLPQYLDWRAGAGKSNNVESTAQEFEQELKGKLKEISSQFQELPPEILRNILKGFATVLSKLLNDDSFSLSAIASLLKDRKGLWGSQSEEFIDSIKQDLNNMITFANYRYYQDRDVSYQSGMSSSMARHASFQEQPSLVVQNDSSVEFINDESWRQIWEDIAPFWRTSNSYPGSKEEYTKFAELFEKIEEYDIALVFYHISKGTLSPGKFKFLTQLKDMSRKKYAVKVYDVIVKREKSFSEKTFTFFVHYIISPLWEDPAKDKSSMERNMRNFLTIGMVSLSFISGVSIGNVNLIILPFFGKNSNSTRDTIINPEKPVGTEDPRYISEHDRGNQKNAISAKIIMSEKREKLAANITSIYGLKRELESERTKLNQASSDEEIGEEILKEIGFNEGYKSDILKITQILNTIDNTNPRKSIDEELSKKDWNLDAINKAIKPIDKISGNTPLTDISNSNKNTALQKIKTKILKKWYDKGQSGSRPW
jgi:hypothetical protein